MSGGPLAVWAFTILRPLDDDNDDADDDSDDDNDDDDSDDDDDDTRPAFTHSFFGTILGPPQQTVFNFCKQGKPHIRAGGLDWRWIVESLSSHRQVGLTLNH